MYMSRKGAFRPRGASFRVGLCSSICFRHVRARTAGLQADTACMGIPAEDNRCWLPDPVATGSLQATRARYHALKEPGPLPMSAFRIMILRNDRHPVRIISSSLCRTCAMYDVPATGSSDLRRRAAEGIVRSVVARISSTGGTVFAGEEKRKRAFRTRWSAPAKIRPTAVPLRCRVGNCSRGGAARRRSRRTRQVDQKDPHAPTRSRLPRPRDPMSERPSIRPRVAAADAGPLSAAPQSLSAAALLPASLAM